MEKLEYQIRQNDKIILSGDKTSIMMIFNNLIGKFFTHQEYEKYKIFAETQGFILNKPFEVVINNIVLCRGTFK